MLDARQASPIPACEQISERMTETRQKMFSVKKTVRPNQCALLGRVANLDAFLVGIDDPRNLTAAGEKVFQPLVNFPPGVGRGKNLNGEIGSATKEIPAGWTPSGQPGPGDEGDVRRTAIPVLHPETGAGFQDDTETMRAIVRLQREQQPRADVSMLKVVLRTHNQFAVHQLMNVTIVGQRLEISLGPDLRRRLGCRNHGLNIGGRG